MPRITHRSVATPAVSPSESSATASTTETSSTEGPRSGTDGDRYNPHSNTGSTATGGDAQPAVSVTSSAGRNMIGLLNANRSVDGDALQPITDHRFSSLEAFKQLSPADQKRLVEVEAQTFGNGKRWQLENLLKRSTDEGTPLLLSRSPDREGPSVLDALHGVATGPRHLELSEQRRKSDLGQLLRELDEPDRAVNQGNRGTCGATVITHDLAAHEPAEYARLVHSLMATGEATLRNGDRIHVPADAFAEDRSDRSTSERLMQSALMQYAHPDSTYHNAWADPVRDGGGQGGLSRDGYDDRKGGGLATEEVERIAEGVYAKEHTVYDGSSFLFRNGTRMISHAKSLLDQGQRPVLAFIKWPPSQHIVEITKVEGGRVYFRNPIGGPDPYSGGRHDSLRVGQDGANYLKPQRRVEDSSDALVSMTEDAFASEVREIIGPGADQD